MRFKASLFDLDGTLLNTLDDLAEAGNAALAALHFPEHPVDAYRYYVGDGLRILVERIVPQGTSEERISACERNFKQHYGLHWAEKTSLYPGIAPLLADLTNMGLQLAILSNKPDDFTRLCVGRYFSGIAFHCVHGQRAGVPKKPDPAGALLIAEEMGLSPAEILYVGDTATDMRTGKGAGMTTAGVLWGFRERRELEESGADHIIRHPQEIVQLCQRM